MLNYVQPGKTLTLTAPYTVTSGNGMLVGSIFAVATTDAASGATVEALLEGVFTLPKTNAQAWTVGALVYWDNTAKVSTTTATDNTLIGVATAVASNPSTTGNVRLNGAFAA